MRKGILLGLAIAVLAAAPAASAAEIEVKMLNKGEKGAMVFEPDFIEAAVGDTVRFVAADKGHNVESIKGMVPEGVDPVKGKINEEIVITIEKEGLYGVKCTPHYGMGMVALIAAGEPVNEEAARAAKQNGKAKARFEEIFAAYDASK
jgi:pseudoazurin